MFYGSRSWEDFRPVFRFGTCAIPVGRRGSSDAFWDDIYTVSMPDVCMRFTHFSQGFVDGSGDPRALGVAFASARHQGSGTLLGHPDFFKAYLDKWTAGFHSFKMRNQHGCSWFVLLQPDAITLPEWWSQSRQRSSVGDDEGLWRCWCAILQILVDQEELWSAASMPLVLGGVRVRTPAYWSSSVGELEEPSTPFLLAATEAARTLAGTMGFDPPVGTLQRMELDHLFETQMILSQERCAKVGSMKPAGGSKSTTARSCSPESQTRGEHSAFNGGSETTIPSHLFWVVLRDNPSPCLSAGAHVAATFVATIVQLAFGCIARICMEAKGRVRMCS